MAGPEAAPGGAAGRPTYNTGMRAVRPHRQEPPQARLSSNGTPIQALAVDGEPEWLTRQIAAGPETRLRFWVDVGTLETGTVDAFAPGIDQRAANRHLRTVLTAKGADVTYHEAPGGHDFATFRR